MILNLLKNFISFYGEHKENIKTSFFFLFCQIVDNPVSVPFHPHKGIAAWEINLLKLFILGCFLCKAEAGQGKECTDNEKLSQSPQDLRTGTSGTSLHSLWKNVKSCASVTKGLSVRAAHGDKRSITCLSHGLCASDPTDWPDQWQTTQQRMLNCNREVSARVSNWKLLSPVLTAQRNIFSSIFKIYSSLFAPFYPTTQTHIHAQTYTHHTHAILHTANTYTRTPTSHTHTAQTLHHIHHTHITHVHLHHTHTRKVLV